MIAERFKRNVKIISARGVPYRVVLVAAAFEDCVAIIKILGMLDAMKFEDCKS